ncbi:amidohydrolase family protein [Actinoplanes sp. N902-109]|uniref:amidohydrolase family protein n=1 Tax=Actinoplanes sp. (strain N902-109) TaxID=649831 RepID=UPI000329421E|nr:amidohydrolase family protein [Actinoplanes sp. N902-109]AGL18886.1 PE-PGRS family protein [Actinoplanes sp. N902-109]
MIFDFHARRHPGLPGVLTAAGIDRALVSAGGLIDLDRLSVQLDDGGRAAVGAANEDVAALCARSAGRLLPCFFADPVRDVPSYRERAGDFRGLEISPAVHGFELADPGVHELVTIAAAHRHPVYVVTTARPGSRPADLARLARRHPGSTFVWGHCGHTGLGFAGLAAIAPVPTILAELSGCLTVTARAAVDRLGASRVLFGTEFPLQHPSVELAKLAALPLTAAQRHAVTWANACRLLNEEM